MFCSAKERPIIEREEISDAQGKWWAKLVPQQGSLATRSPDPISTRKVPFFHQGSEYRSFLRLTGRVSVRGVAGTLRNALVGMALRTPDLGEAPEHSYSCQQLHESICGSYGRCLQYTESLTVRLIVFSSTRSVCLGVAFGRIGG